MDSSNHFEVERPIILIGGKKSDKPKELVISPEIAKRNFKARFMKLSDVPPKFLDLPATLPAVTVTPPKIFERPLSKVAKISGGQAFWQNGYWHVKSTGKTSDEVVTKENNFFRGSIFIECEDGVYSLSKEGVAGQRITNATIRIVALNIRIRADDTVEEFLTCAVGCSDAWGQREEEVEIASDDFKIEMFSSYRAAVTFWKNIYRRSINVIFVKMRQNYVKR